MAFSSKREIVEVDRHVGMVRPVALLVDRQRAAHQRLGLGEAVGAPKQRARLLRRSPHWVIRAVALFDDRERAALQQSPAGVLRLDFEQPPSWLNSRAVGSAISASSAWRATASACGASGSRTGQSRTSCGIADEGRVHPFQRLAQSRVAGAPRSSRGGRNPARGDARRSLARRRPRRLRPK